MFYSIRELARYSGIKPHTIRIWEQRYDILSPHRTDTNIRYYDDEQLHKLLNVTSLVNAGHKISKVSAYSDAELIEAIKALQDDPDYPYARFDHARNALLSATLTFDEPQFVGTLKQCIDRMGLEDTYREVIGPLLSQTGLLWRQHDMDPSQEHFASALIRQTISAAINDLPVAKADTGCWLLFLPEQEEHEVGLLFAHFLLRKAGEPVIYLGPRVPMSSLVSAAELTRPDLLLTFFTAMFSIEESQAYIDQLVDQFPGCNICVAGAPAILDQIITPNRVTLLTNVDDLVTILSDQPATIDE
ncbi:MAG: MerR family transcriptional regulator [Saprospiraceae bacterium]|nr:MerR family transcriptional regulator [Saprospiraceae bacterium]